MTLRKELLPYTFGPIAESNDFEFQANHDQIMMKHKPTEQLLILDWEAASELLATLVTLDIRLDFSGVAGDISDES